jgi:hypothetical protein
MFAARLVWPVVLAVFGFFGYGLNVFRHTKVYKL